MRWCERCQRRLYDDDAVFCPFDGTRLEAPDPPPGASDPHLGETLLGQFHLLAPVGAGAMGTVYRAWQSGMERQVAVKMLREDLLGDTELRHRFVREARAAARLSHPNIVCVHLVGETESGAPYMVMEHLDGETLEDLLEREGRLAPERALAIALQIASALVEAHDAGVIHRDLKPANVMLLRRRSSDRADWVKILDFGIAKMAGRALLECGSTRLTREGAVFGTPHYIAPEQAQGASVDGRADLYSVGVLLYRMLSGRLPFDGAAVAVLLAHICRTPPHLAEVAPALDPALAQLVMRCLAKNPAERFATADELACALEQAHEAARPAGARARTSGALTAARASRALSTSRSWSANANANAGADARAAADSGATPAVLAARSLAATAGPPLRRRRSRSARRRSTALARTASASAIAPRRRRSRRVGLIAAAALVLCAGTGGAAFLAQSHSHPGRLPAAVLPPPVPMADPVPPSPRGAQATTATPASLPVSAPLPIARRSVIVGESGYSLRALLPEHLLADQPNDIVLDLWGPGGEPLAASFLDVRIYRTEDQDGPFERDRARSLAGSPGRYILLGPAATAPGPAYMQLSLPGGSHIHLHFDLEPADPLASQAL